MSIVKRPKHEIILRYLQQGEGERKIKLIPNAHHEFGMYNNQLHHILWNNGDEVWYISDMSLNWFIKCCEQISDEDIIKFVADIALTETKRSESRR